MATHMVNSVLDEKSFRAIADLAYRESGLQLVSGKSSMIQSRLRHRLRALGVEDFEAYAAYVCSDRGVSERREMISALTTNVSHFFREKHHFDILTQKLLPPLLKRIRAGGRLRIWSAGCSNGQEAYSIAMAVLEAQPDLLKQDFRILATDIDPNVVAFASHGAYPQRLLGGVPAELLTKYFTANADRDDATYRVTEALRSVVVFKELNLLSSWPMKQPMDAIFCRNVVIYFDIPTQIRLWPRFRQALGDDGFLFLGHSERISEPSRSGFRNVGPTSYMPVSLPAAT